MAFGLAMAVALSGTPASAAQFAGPGSDDPTASALAIAGLDGTDVATSTALTEALRGSASRRGLLLTPDATLSEIRLTGGCADNAPACLTRGTALVGGDELLYGALELRADGGGVVTLALIRNKDALVLAESSTPLDPAELAAEAIDGTADRLLAELIPMPDEAPGEVHVPAPEPSPETTKTGQTEPRTRQLIWGPYSPRPRWKPLLFGFSLAATVISVTGLAATLGSLPRARRETIEAAEDSRSGEAPVSSTSLGGICTEARGDPSQTDVYNAEVATLCRRGNALARASTGFVVATGLSTLVLTTSIIFLFVRRAPKRNGISPEISRGGAGVRISHRF
ncbi:MAG: hypothetical protein AAF721_03000 [Myxococcota bacterium]